MAMSVNAVVTKNDVTLALDKLAKGIDGAKVSKKVSHGLVYEFFPEVFYSNMYGWAPTKRDGTPLVDTSTHLVSGTGGSVKLNASETEAGPTVTIRHLFKYAYIHDRGATITAKNERTVVQNVKARKGSKKKGVIARKAYTRTVKMKVLAFKIRGEKTWRHAKSVTIPARRFMYVSPQMRRYSTALVNEYIGFLVSKKAQPA